MSGYNELIIFVLIIAFVLIAAAITLYIFFLINLRNLLREISDTNRLIPANNVFLILIPFFGFVYSFIMFSRISNSIKAEYETRQKVLPGDGLRSLGLVFSILMIASPVINNAFPQFSGLAGLASLIIFIIYWVKSSQIKKDLMNSGELGKRADLLD